MTRFFQTVIFTFLVTASAFAHAGHLERVLAAGEVPLHSGDY